MTPPETIPELGTRTVVLYVEDHPVNAILMQTVFELRPQLELVVAVDGASALAAAQRLRPALLLLDLRLPDCHGVDLLVRLQDFPGWRAIPAIAVTAEAEFMPGGTGFVDVWHKPLHVHTLLDRLDRALGAEDRLDRRMGPGGAAPALRGAPEPLLRQGGTASATRFAR